MYKFHLPTHVIFGVNALEKLAEEISRTRKDFPSKVLIVTTGDGWCTEFLNSIRDRLLQKGSKMVRYFDRVLPNPDYRCVESCVESCRNFYCDALIALGGGSSMDVAKTAAWEVGIDFLVTIPTTAGTGSEISPWAVITNERTREKESSITKTPDLAILDPFVTLSMPPELTLFSGLDAFAHGFEAYVSKAANGLTDAFALHAVQLITENLPNTVECGEDIEIRSRMLEGSLLAGIAMLHAGLGLIHAIANTIGGMYHTLPHGLIISNLIEEVMRYNQTAIPAQKYGVVERAVWKITRMLRRQLRKKLSVPDVKLHKKDIELIVERSVKNVNAATNPHDFTPADIERIIKQSFTIG